MVEVTQMFSQYAYMYVKCNSIRTNMQVHDHSRSCLIAGLDCGLDCWSGLLDWTDGLDCGVDCGVDCGLDCWTGLLDWTVGLDCWTGLWAALRAELLCSYHMTSTQSDMQNLVTLTALCCYKLHLVIPLHGRECASAQCTSCMDGCVSCVLYTAHSTFWL